MPPAPGWVKTHILDLRTYPRCYASSSCAVQANKSPPQLPPTYENQKKKKEKHDRNKEEALKQLQYVLRSSWSLKSPPTTTICSLQKYDRNDFSASSCSSTTTQNVQNASPETGGFSSAIPSLARGLHLAHYGPGDGDRDSTRGRLEPERTRKFTRRGGMEPVQELLKTSRGAKQESERGNQGEERDFQTIKTRARNPTRTISSYTHPRREGLQPTHCYSIFTYDITTVFFSHATAVRARTRKNGAQVFRKT